MLGRRWATAPSTGDCVFEMFARRLPTGRRYGVVAGTGRLLDALATFRFGPDSSVLAEPGSSTRALDWLAEWRFTGDVDGYPEGELLLPGSPVLTVTARSPRPCCWRRWSCRSSTTTARSPRPRPGWSTAAGDRPLIEMGSRRTHEEAAVAAARAAYLAGFASTSNLEAGRAIRRAHRRHRGARVHAAARRRARPRSRAQVDALGVGTTLLVDTYDIARASGPRSRWPGRSWARSGSTPATWPCSPEARELLDCPRRDQDPDRRSSGDLDEFAIAGLAAGPVDVYGVGTSVVTGSGAPTAGMVYKLVEVEGRPVAKRSENKATQGGRKIALRRHRATGTATEEVLVSRGRPEPGRTTGCCRCRWCAPAGASAATRPTSGRPANGWQTRCGLCPGRA